MKLLDLLMRPANVCCDRLGLVDENERGVVRMLVNALLWTIIGAALAWAVVLG
ncbi:MAG: hypothetical protein JSR55_03005 [Proteobacteria bacterium]|nr:hypothetical protein [Pseudomonadota bacterium]